MSRDDPPGDVGEAEVAAAVAEGQFLVVEAQEVEDRGVQVDERGRVSRPPRSRSSSVAP